jgi:hypothetical protein
MKNKKETRGGTRQGSGAKPKYNEQTKTVAFRCPLSKVDELKLIVKSKLSEWSAGITANGGHITLGWRLCTSDQP